MPNWLPRLAAGVAVLAACQGPPRAARAVVINTISGTAAAAETHMRRVKSVNSWLGSSEGSIGSSAMPQIGHEPGASRIISGCIGQV